MFKTGPPARPPPPTDADLEADLPPATTVAYLDLSTLASSLLVGMAHAAFNLTSGPIPLARCDVLSSFATDDAYQARIDGGYRNPLCVNVVGPMLVGTIMK